MDGTISRDVFEFLNLPTSTTFDRESHVTEYNDYLFIAWSPDWSVSDTVQSTIDQKKTVTLTLDLGE